MTGRSALKNETAKSAVKTLNKMSNYVIGIIILAGTISAIMVALSNPLVFDKTQPAMMVALTGAAAIFLGSFLAALASGAFIYFFAAVNKATVKAKHDIEDLVTKGVIKIRTSNKNKTVIWEAIDIDASNTDVGVEIQRTGSVGSFFPRQILEKMSQTVQSGE